MTKSKYNWNELKTKYITGKIEDVSVFIRQELGSDKAKHWNIFRHTKWRKQDRISYWNTIMKDYKPPLNTTIDFKAELDESMDFLNLMMKYFRIGIVKNIQKWKFPTIEDLTKYWKLLSNYSWLKLWTDKNLENPWENTPINYLKERLEKIKKKKQ